MKEKMLRWKIDKTLYFWLKNIYQKSDKFFLLPIISSIVSIIMITFFILIFFNRLPPELPLFYSLPWGETQLISKERFFILPIIIILTALINSFIASQLHSLQFVLKRILMLSLLLINLIILITVMNILSIFI